MEGIPICKDNSKRDTTPCMVNAFLESVFMPTVVNVTGLQA